MRAPLPLAVALIARLVLMWLTGETMEEAMLWPPDWQTIVAVLLGVAVLIWALAPLLEAQPVKTRKQVRIEQEAQDAIGAETRCKNCGLRFGIHSKECWKWQRSKP